MTIKPRPVTVLYPPSTRVALRMADHYFTATPSSPSQPATVYLHLPDTQMTFLTDRGVFSGSRVDAGTLALLREGAPPPAEGDLLDLGCGYGPLACVLARRAPGAIVWAVDVNSRAVELTRANAAALGLRNVRAARPDEVPPGIVFMGLWSNPPIRIGKAALHELLSQWMARLAPVASAWLVVNRHLGSDSLAAWLTDQHWQVRRAASKAGYRVLEVTRSSGPDHPAQVSPGRRAARDEPGQGRMRSPL
jgi:16S rRNA G1207 methylase RsmC